MTKEAITEVADNDLLGNFSWDSETSFFGVEPVEKETPVNEVVTTEKTTEPVVETTEPEEDELFPDTEKKTENSDESEEDDEEETDKNFYTTLTKELKEKDIFQTIDIEKAGEVTEEKFFELMDEEVEGRVSIAIQDFAEKLGNHQTSNAFVNYIKAGGDPDKFFDFYSQSRSVPEVDIDKEKDQDLILKHYYKVIEQLDEDDIEDKLDWLKESGKKKKYAEKYYTKLKEDEKLQKEQFIADETEAQKARDDGKKQFIASLKSTLIDVDTVNGFTFTKEDKSSLPDYIIKPAVKLKNNQYLTQFQVDLNENIKGGGENLLLLAKMLKSKFDTSGLVAQKKTEVIKDIKSSLQIKKSKLSSSATNSKRKSIADYF